MERSLDFMRSVEVGLRSQAADHRRERGGIEIACGGRGESLDEGYRVLTPRGAWRK